MTEIFNSYVTATDNKDILFIGNLYHNIEYINDHYSLVHFMVDAGECTENSYATASYAVYTIDDLAHAASNDLPLTIKVDSAITTYDYYLFSIIEQITG